MDGGGKTVQGRQDGFVAHVLLRLRRKQGVDARRQAVSDGMADNGVAVGHGFIALSIRRRG